MLQSGDFLLDPEIWKLAPEHCSQHGLGYSTIYGKGILRYLRSALSARADLAFTSHCILDLDIVLWHAPSARSV